MDLSELTSSASNLLGEAADPEKAGPMAAYMKTDMPFYGVQTAGRKPIVKSLVRTFVPADRDEYEAAVLALWDLPHREEKYLAIGYASGFPEFVVIESLELYRRLIVEGAWWDLVDGVAPDLVGHVLATDRERADQLVRRWILDEDMWLRRSSIICQLRHKDQTDTALLADACLANLPDTEFFVRKAIGWALRQYARVSPEWVRSFTTEHRDQMSGLSYREATKHL